MIYLDSSSVLKLLWNEPETSAVVEAINRESVAVVSSLTELEALIQLKAAFLGGEYNRPQWRRLEAQLGLLRNRPPFEFCSLPGTLFQTALRQHRNAGPEHCRSMDRLHLAAMEELHISRLITNDGRQARAAVAAGFAVVQPGVASGI
jgi:predicted nucleic acid-binding protein